jgi:hypothetical protein
VGDVVIEEPQLSYLLELLYGLGENANHFILVGARAMNFNVKEGRGTKDFDFVLSVQILRNSRNDISSILKSLGYDVIENSKYFQFDKKIPGSNESIRIGFLAPEEEGTSFRVKIQDKFHARSGLGAEIVYNESYTIELNGMTPDGNPLKRNIRIARIWAVLMLKIIALDDRYKNIRGVGHANHDRDEARIHSSDVIKIINDHIRSVDFADNFWRQINDNLVLKDRITQILKDFFTETTSPGIQLYREFVGMQESVKLDEDEEQRIIKEVEFLISRSN